MTRRRIIALAAAGLFLLASTAVLESQCILTGWWKGEAFWQGRPSSYWLRQARAYKWCFAHVPIRQDMWKFCPVVPAEPESWLDRVDDFMPACVKLRQRTVHIPRGPESLKVLEEMRLELRESELDQDLLCLSYIDHRIRSIREKLADPEPK